VSLEGQQLWLLGLLPLTRRRMIVAKFLYALTITLVAATAVMCASSYRLDLPRTVVVAHLLSSFAVCVGLCGVSVGMGARLPVFTERNPARIAGGFGGTISLLLSVGLVVLSLTGLGIMTFRSAQAGVGVGFTVSMAIWVLAVLVLNGTAALIALILGIRHFNRIQF
jgi:ABC-2 type transport system permease protein